MNLNQVTVYTNKPIDTVEFYEKLGLLRIVDSLPRYARFECPDGDSTLSIHFTDDVVQPGNIVLYFECKALDSTVGELKAKGLRFEQDPKDEDWLWREAYLNDPNGNKICLFQACENRKNPPWRVK